MHFHTDLYIHSLCALCFRFEASVNDEDLYSTAKVECSSEWFTIDRADIHIMGGPQREEKRDGGDYVKGKEAGIMVTVTPKHYSTGPRDVKFSIRCTFKTKMQLKEDKGSKESAAAATTADGGDDDDKKGKKKKSQQPLVEVEMPYVLDFDLGPPKTVKDVAAKSAAAAATAVKTAAPATVPATSSAAKGAGGRDPSSVNE